MSEKNNDNVALENNTEQPTGAKRQPTKRKGRWLYKTAIVGGVVVLVPLVFLATGKGQRTAIELADKYLDQLSIESVEGSIQDGLTLKNAKFVMDGVDVEAGEVDLHVGFGCLLHREACVENVAVKDTNVVIDTSKLPPSEEKEPREPFTELNLPLGIAVKNVALDNISVKVDEMDIALSHFHTGMTGKGRALTLLPTELSGLQLSLAPSADEKTAEGAKEAEQQAVENAQKSANATPVKTDWNAIKEKLAQPILTKLDPIKLPLDAEIQQFTAKDIAVEQKVKKADGSYDKPQSLVKVESVALQAKADQQSVTLFQLDVKSDRGNVNGQGNLTLADNYPLAWNISADAPELSDLKIPASQAKVDLSGELFGKTVLNLQTSGAVKATLKGDVQLAEAKTPLNLSLVADSVQYPFMPEKGQDPLKLQNVALNLSGNLLNYQLNTALKASGMGIPTADISLKGQGEITNFSLNDLSLKALDGSANLAGKVDWSNGVEWDAKTTLSNLNTKSLVPDWAAQLSGGLNSKGYAGRGEKGDEWNAEVSKMDIKGSLFQKPLALTGDLTASSKTLLNVPTATLVYGENRIAMKGVLSDKSDFSADIKAPNLQGLAPKLAASINGNVKLTGKITEPNLDLDLTANNVSYDQYKLNHLSAKGKVTTEKAIQGNIELGVNQFAFGDIKVESANLVASGSEANHTLKLTSKGNPVGANLQISGKFDRLQQVWSGQLSDVAIQTTDFGTFKNDHSVSVNYNNKQINANIGAHCWSNPKINLCFPKAFNAGQEGNVPFEIRRFDLAMLKEYLGDKSQLSGIVDAKGDASWFKNKQPQVNVDLTSNVLRFVQQLDGGKSFPITLAPLKINAKMADNNLSVKSDLKIENNGRITTDLKMNDLSKARTLSGSVNIDQLTLKLIQPLLGKGESVNGNINARLSLAGSATSPLLHGRLDLTQLTAKATSMPFDVTGGGLSMNFNGATSTLTGRVQTTESELRLEGDADWRRLDAWRSHVKARANRFRVDVPNIAKVDISPNIEVTATPKELILGGDIEIPWARIEVDELPASAVSVSDDEVIMDGSAKKKVPFAQRQMPQQTSSGMAIKANVNIKIGDDVKLKAYGLNTDLDGLIKVSQGKNGLGLYGSVNLKNGRYASFGQDLLIRKGLIQFFGLPSQPTLNIEAIRNPEAMEDSSVTAGVKVLGIADSPEVKVFSEPSMSQDQALSYILTGRSLENSGDAGSSNSMAAALLSMSLAKSSKMVGDVGSTFGLKDLSVSTAGIGDNTKVEVSASLAPKFKVKYGVGIFAPLTELTLRYTLAPQLYLQWISSVNQAVNVMYRFEFD